MSGLGNGTLSKIGRFTSFALTPSSWKLLLVGRCPLTLIVTWPRASAAESNSSVLAPADRVRSVKKFRVESGSVLAVSASMVSPVVAEVRSTGKATSLTVTVSVTCPRLRVADTFAVSVTRTRTLCTTNLENPVAVISTL